MNTREFVQRIDTLIETGKGIVDGQSVEESDTTGASDELRAFFHDVKSLEDDIRGFERHAARDGHGIGLFGAEELKKSLAILEKQRSLILYSGEFGY